MKYPMYSLIKLLEPGTKAKLTLKLPLKMLQTSSLHCNQIIEAYNTADTSLRRGIPQLSPV